MYDRYLFLKLKNNSLKIAKFKSIQYVCSKNLLGPFPFFL